MYVPPTQPTDASTAAMRVRLRPMGIGDILDETFSLYRENFSLLYHSKNSGPGILGPRSRRAVE